MEVLGHLSRNDTEKVLIFRIMLAERLLFFKNQPYTNG
jgi:hypothetical protein